MSQIFDVAIIGGGPAGLTSALYSARGGLKTVLIEKLGMGGQAALTYSIDNYPGIPEVSGIDLGTKMASQIEKFGVEIVYDEVKNIDVDNKVISTEYSGDITAKSIVLAMGATSKLIGVPGEVQLTGRGVCYCAVCDGAFFKDKVVAVIGGGNTAVEDALYLTRFASKVYLIHRRNEFRAGKVLSDTVKDSPVEIIWDSVVLSISGENKVNGIKIKNVKTSEIRDIELDGVFVAIGQTPKSELVKDKVDVNPEGYIVTDEDMKTNKSGIYAAGDIRVKNFRQIVTAAADGAIASLAIGHYLLSELSK